MNQTPHLIEGRDRLGSIVYSAIWLGPSERIIARAEMFLAADVEVSAVKVIHLDCSEGMPPQRREIHETRVPF